MTILVGAWPIVATAASPCATLTEPNSLESSTRPSSTISEVLPSPSTVIVQSVPRMAAAAAGVSMVRPSPPRSARAQIAAGLRGRGRCPRPPPICLTSSVVLRPSRICVLSANSTASCPLALVRSTSPRQKVLMDVDAAPVRKVDEAHFLAGLAGDHRAGRRRGALEQIGRAPASPAPRSDIRRQCCEQFAHRGLEFPTSRRLMRIGNSACQVSVAAAR